MNCFDFWAILAYFRMAYAEKLIEYSQYTLRYFDS